MEVATYIFFHIVVYIQVKQIKKKKKSKLLLSSKDRAKSECELAVDCKTGVGFKWTTLLEMSSRHDQRGDGVVTFCLKKGKKIK